MQLRAILGASARLRDEALAPLTAAWSGTLRRAADPADVRAILADIDTPSLFGEPTLWVVRASEAWLKAKANELHAIAGQESLGGGLLLVAAKLDGRTPLAKSLAASVIHADPPWAHLRWGDAVAACKGWIAERLARHSGGVQRPVLCADRLYAYAAEDADLLLAAMDVLSLYADTNAITPEAVDAVVVGSAERPPWEFSGAVLTGDAGKAIGLLHAGQGIDPPHALAVLIGELRKQIASLESPDDAEAGRIAGLKTRPNLRMVRNQAQRIGRTALLRLLGGAIRTQRLMRTSGSDPALEIELLVLHARQLLAAGKR